MRNDTFEHLQGLCAGRRIVCERYGRKVELVTPDGSVTAECENVSEALDVVRHDPAFCNLPIVLAKPAEQLKPAERYDYVFVDRNNVFLRTQAETLSQAIEQVGGGYMVEFEALGMALLKSTQTGFNYGVTWKRL